ncbi:hypothetical protein D3C71_1336050 [compost metagenome]
MHLPGEVARCNAQSVDASRGVACDRDDTLRAKAAWNSGSHCSAMVVAEKEAFCMEVSVVSASPTGSLPVAGAWITKYRLVGI